MREEARLICLLQNGGFPVLGPGRRLWAVAASELGSAERLSFDVPIVLGQALSAR